MAMSKQPNGAGVGPEFADAPPTQRAEPEVVDAGLKSLGHCEHVCAGLGLAITEVGGR
jgi:hypothetical protein